MIYRRKIIDKINNFLDSKEIIVLHGARQVGKTSIMNYLIEGLKKNKQNNVYYFDLEISRYLDLANAGHETFVNYLKSVGYQKKAKAYVFIDEIQYLDNPSQFLKLFHDNFSNQIKLIVSGSSSFEIKRKFKNSLVGRTINFEIWPLDFEEFLLFKNKNYNLSINNMPLAAIEELKELYHEYASYGGYPQIVLTEEISKKEAYLNQIINTYVKKDIRDLVLIKNVVKFNKLIEVLAGQTGNLLNVAELANTVDIARQTVEQFLFLLENTYIIKLIRPFHKNIRSELFKTPKIYLVDHGLANLLVNKSFPRVLSGNIFETAVFSDLLKNYGADKINFWRTTSKQEVDFIIKQDNSFLPIEVKINPSLFKQRNMTNFFELYKLKSGWLVFLQGEITLKKQLDKKIKAIYPWQIIRQGNEK
ncbi:MAG: ATP-binding protein [Patescibacteria group bacterium]